VAFGELFVGRLLLSSLFIFSVLFILFLILFFFVLSRRFIISSFFPSFSRLFHSIFHSLFTSCCSPCPHLPLYLLSLHILLHLMPSFQTQGRHYSFLPRLRLRLRWYLVRVGRHWWGRAGWVWWASVLGVGWETVGSFVSWGGGMGFGC